METQPVLPALLWNDVIAWENVSVPLSEDVIEESETVSACEEGLWIVVKVQNCRQESYMVPCGVGSFEQWNDLNMRKRN